MVGGVVLVAANAHSTPAVAGLPQVQVGAHYDRASATLSVSGRPRAGEPVYARLHTGADFGTASLLVLVARKEGAGWQTVQQISVTLAPNDNVAETSVPALTAGTYQITWVANNQTIGQTTFQVAP